jgi:hypothetical protein
MTELLYGPTLWSRIRAQAAAVSSRKAAVAYVGQHADELISFKAGDTVVIDGSRNALRSGATNPDTIATWLKAGANLYSYEGLHAKVLVLGQTVFVGSANLSWHSHNDLMEAAVVDTSSGLRRSAVEMIEALVASSLEPIDRPWVREAEQLYRPPRGPLPGARSGSAGPFLPPGPFRLLIGQWQGDIKFTAAEARQDEEARALLRKQRGPARTYDLLTWVIDPGDTNVRRGDVWVLVDLDEHDNPAAVISPTRVLRVLDLSGKKTAAYLRHDLTLHEVEFEAARKAVHDAGGRWVYNRNIIAPGVRAALLHMWGLHE